MPHLKEHEEQSIEAFGKPYTEVHVFLDQFFPRFRGAEHRRILHTVEGVQEVVRRFGEESRPVAELHIKEDWHRYCGVRAVPERKEIDLNNWLLLNYSVQEYMDELIVEVWKEKV